MQKKKKKKLGCFPFLFLISLAIVVGISFIYLKDEKEYDDIREEVIQPPSPKEKKKKKGYNINWSKLPKECSLWLRFKHPKDISYPVMYNEDNGYYLHRNIHGDYAYAGSIFLDCHNKTDMTDDNTIIYGHNMANGTMFGQLKKFKEPDYWEKNQFFYIYSRDGYRYKYQIYNVVQVSPESDIYTYEFGSNEKMDEYIDEWIEKGLYETGLRPTASDKIVSLSTCAVYGTKRLVIQGMLVKKDKNGE